MRLSKHDNTRGLTNLGGSGSMRCMNSQILKPVASAFVFDVVAGSSGHSMFNVG